jgi:gamma-glutamylcyclotransferase (GGCT)/AIG2-like uncharacterized protein YtfP
MNNKKTLISVYGSLRKDMGNDHLLSDSKYLGTFNSEPVFSLYSLSYYPGLKTNGNTSVVMEVYEVNDKVAQRIDNLEGYNPNKPATFYDKIPIETPWGTASVYIYVNDIPEERLVESGDWKQFKNNLQQNVVATY